MSGKHRFLERSDPDAAVSVDEPLSVLTILQIRVENGLDRIDDIGRRKGRPDDRADRRLVVAGTAKGYLIIFFVVLVDAENADMADMVMAAGIDAARDVEMHLSDMMLPVEIGEALGEALRHRNRARRREPAIVEPGAGDDVADQVHVGRGEAERSQRRPQLMK